MNKKVKVEIGGRFTNAGVLVESTGYAFYGPGKRTKIVGLQGFISVSVSVLGAMNDEFVVLVSINGVTKSIPGRIDSPFKRFTTAKSYTMAEFNL